LHDVGAERREMRDGVVAKGVADPGRVPDGERVRPLRENRRMLLGADRRAVDALAEAGQVGCDRMRAAGVERSRETTKVLARHAEAVDKNDVAASSGGSMRDAVRPAGESP